MTSRVVSAPPHLLQPIRPPGMMETWWDPMWTGYSNKLQKRFSDLMDYQGQVVGAAPIRPATHAKMEVLQNKLIKLQADYDLKAQDTSRPERAQDSCKKYAMNLTKYVNGHKVGIGVE
ncbi:hypothetical protein H1R20_g816, partial [Candolleomyces eurysporus]